MSDDGHLDWPTSGLSFVLPSEPVPTFRVGPLLEFLRARADEQEPPAGPQLLVAVNALAKVIEVDPDGFPGAEGKRTLARMAAAQFADHPDFAPNWKVPDPPRS